MLTEMTRVILTSLTLILAGCPSLVNNPPPDPFDTDAGDSSGLPPPIVNTPCWDVVLCYNLDEGDLCTFYFEALSACEFCDNVPGVGYPCDVDMWISQCGNLDLHELACVTTCNDDFDEPTADDFALAWDYFYCSRTNITDGPCNDMRAECRGE